MRINEHGELVLSEHNMLTLLTLLHTAEAEPTIWRAGIGAVRAEADETHYAGRQAGTVRVDHELYTELRDALREHDE